VTSWDILSGDAAPGSETLVYDDNGGHPALQAAELLAEASSQVEIITPERFFAPEIGGLNHVAYAQIFQRHDVTITLNTRVRSIKRDGNKLVARLASDYGPFDQERHVDQVVVEHGTLPLDDLYFELKPNSLNAGAVDYRAMIAGRPQEVVSNPNGGFRLWRIGDAVSSRNVHAAIYDALRLCKDL
jgi:hypothetical protein